MSLTVMSNLVSAHQGLFRYQEVTTDQRATARDDNEAIDESNIIDSKTRGAKPRGGYTEPGDEEGLPGPEDGTKAPRYRYVETSPSRRGWYIWLYFTRVNFQYNLK
jgi:hypothetical protein